MSVWDNAIQSMGTVEYLDPTALPWINVDVGDTSWTVLGFQGSYVLAHDDGVNPWKMSMVLSLGVDGVLREGPFVGGSPVGVDKDAITATPYTLPANYYILAYWQPGVFPFLPWDQGSFMFPGFGWASLVFPYGSMTHDFGVPNATTACYTLGEVPGFPGYSFWDDLTVDGVLFPIDSSPSGWTWMNSNRGRMVVASGEKVLMIQQASNFENSAQTGTWTLKINDHVVFDSGGAIAEGDVHWENAFYVSGQRKWFMTNSNSPLLLSVREGDPVFKFNPGVLHFAYQDGQGHLRPGRNTAELHIAVSPFNNSHLFLDFLGTSFIFRQGEEQASERTLVFEVASDDVGQQERDDQTITVEFLL